MDPRDFSKFGKSPHKVHNPRPSGPDMPLWLAIVLSLILMAGAAAGFLGVF